MVSLECIFMCGLLVKYALISVLFLFFALFYLLDMVLEIAKEEKRLAKGTKSGNGSSSSSKRKHGEDLDDDNEDNDEDAEEDEEEDEEDPVVMIEDPDPLALLYMNMARSIRTNRAAGVKSELSSGAGATSSGGRNFTVGSTKYHYPGQGVVSLEPTGSAVGGVVCVDGEEAGASSSNSSNLGGSSCSSSGMNEEMKWGLNRNVGVDNFDYDAALLLQNTAEGADVQGLVVLEDDENCTVNGIIPRKMNENSRNQSGEVIDLLLSDDDEGRDLGTRGLAVPSLGAVDSESGSSRGIVSSSQSIPSSEQQVFELLSPEGAFDAAGGSGGAANVGMALEEDSVAGGGMVAGAVPSQGPEDFYFNSVCTSHYPVSGQRAGGEQLGHTSLKNQQFAQSWEGLDRGFYDDSAASDKNDESGTHAATDTQDPFEEHFMTKEQIILKAQQAWSQPSPQTAGMRPFGYSTTGSGPSRQGMKFTPTIKSSSERSDSSGSLTKLVAATISVVADPTAADSTTKNSDITSQGASVGDVESSSSISMPPASPKDTDSVNGTADANRPASNPVCVGALDGDVSQGISHMPGVGSETSASSSTGCEGIAEVEDTADSNSTSSAAAVALTSDSISGPVPINAAEPGPPSVPIWSTSSMFAKLR
jgi:hypothetical protein